MKRFAGLMVLMALSTPAHAGSYSFVIGGHRIHVEASRHCRSLSCVSWSDLSKKRDDAATAGQAPAPAPVATPAPVAAVTPAAAPPAPAPQPVAAAPVPQPPVYAAPVQAPPAPQPQIATAPVQTAPAPVAAPVQPQAAPILLKAAETRAVVATPPAPQAASVQPQPKVDAKPEAKPGVGFDVKPEAKAEAKPSVGFDLRPDAKLDPKVEPKVEKKAETKPDSKPDTTPSVTKSPAEKPQADKPAVVAKPAPSKTSLESEGEGIEAPIGDWQTEGRKGLVRIEPCGTALCGYMINTPTNTKGETVLINMKPKSSGKSGSEWSGSIYSRASGNTYYATMSIKRPNTLRVEACVVGRYFCSGNNWTRITTKSDEVTREASAEPR